MAKGGRGKGRVRQDGAVAAFTQTLSPGMVLQSCARGDGVTRKQLRKTRKDGWTPHRRAQFIEALAATCNVRESCRSIGLHFSGAYDLRDRDPAFAEAWERAIAQGFSELEMRILRDCLNGAERVEVTRAGEGRTARIVSTKTVTAVPYAVALRLLQAHRATVEAYRLRQKERQAVARASDPAVITQVRTEVDAILGDAKVRCSPTPAPPMPTPTVAPAA